MGQQGQQDWTRAGRGRGGGRTPTGSGIVPGAWSCDSKKHRMPSSPPTIVTRWWQPLQPGAPGRAGEEWVGQRPDSAPQLQVPSVHGPCWPAPPPHPTSLVADCFLGSPCLRLAMPEFLFLGNFDSLLFKWHLLREASPQCGQMPLSSHSLSVSFCQKGLSHPAQAGEVGPLPQIPRTPDHNVPQEGLCLPCAHELTLGRHSLSWVKGSFNSGLGDQWRDGFQL